MLYVLAALGPFLVDHMTEVFGEPALNRWYSPVLDWIDPKQLYQRSLFGGAHGITPDFVSVVLIKPDKEPGTVTQQNVCTQRAFLARLLLQIAAAHPAVVAIDKSYGCTACTANDPGTVDLKKAIGEVSAQVPVVIGLSTEDPSAVAGADPNLAERLRAKGLEANDQILLPSLDLGGQAVAQRVRYGLIRVDKDIRRVPLGWYTYGSRAALEPTLTTPAAPFACLHVNSGHKTMMDTLSVAAARAFNPKRLNRSLEMLQANMVHPYFSFFREDDLRRLSVSSAIEALCGRSAGADTEWKACEAPLDSEFADEFRNRVVFVG
ncbi:MAG: hypothetical protein C5B51_03505, partial [Terriglobia bacterium]